MINIVGLCLGSGYASGVEGRRWEVATEVVEK